MRLFKAILAISVIFSVVGAQARQMYIGNLSFDGTFKQRGVVLKDTIGAAVCIPTSELQNVIGSELKSISAYQIGSTRPAYMRLFVKHNLDSASVLEQDVDVTTMQEGWNKFELEQSVVLTGDSIYLGYYLLGSGSSSIVPGNTSSVLSYLKKGSDKPWTKLAGLAIYGTIEGDMLPAYDVVVDKIEDAVTVESGKDFEVELLVNNNATETIREIEVVCDYGMGRRETTTVSVEIPYLGVDTIACSFGGFENVGSYEVKIAIAKLNGEEDLTPENNEISLDVDVLERIVERKVLLEVFSTENCTNCPKGHQKVEDALVGIHDRVIEVGHHVGFYTDQWTVEEDTIYTNFYYAAIVTTFAPAGMLDRTLWSRAEGHHNAYQGGDSCVVFSLEGQSTNLSKLFETALNRPALAWIDLGVDFDEQDSILTIKTEGKSVATISGDPRLTIYVTEDNLATDRQAGWNSDRQGLYYQHNVNRYIATDVWGDQVTLNDGFEKEYSVKVRPNWNVDNLNVVAFVHNYSTKPNVKERYTDFNVYNAEKVQVRPHVVDVDNVEKSPIMVVTRPDDTLEILGEYQSGMIYNINGQAVATLRGSPTISMANMQSGVYVVTLTLKDGIKYNIKIVR